MIILLLFPVLVLGKDEFQNSVSSNMTFKYDVENGLQDNATLEDNEHFQDQEHFHVFPHCNEILLEEFSILCWKEFQIDMEHINMEHWCNWEKVIRPYNKLTNCMELCSDYCSCFYPNRVVLDFFIKIHSHFFQDCPAKEDVFPDAPSQVLLTLTLIPVGLIPILIFLVVWNNKGMD